MGPSQVICPIRVTRRTGTRMEGVFSTDVAITGRCQGHVPRHLREDEGAEPAIGLWTESDTRYNIKDEDRYDGKLNITPAPIFAFRKMQGRCDSSAVQMAEHATLSSQEYNIDLHGCGCTMEIANKFYLLHAPSL